jgi:nucleotide-binding universal stress UspA family protein
LLIPRGLDQFFPTRRFGVRHDGAPASPGEDGGMSEIFERVVCGVDHSPAGAIAARLASMVAQPEGSLTLVSVEDPSIAVHAGFQMSSVAAEVAREADAALEDGRAEAEPRHRVRTRLLEGDPLSGLLAEIERRHATLAVVGTHEHVRAVGIALGSVATHLVHEAPCAVLVAREPRVPAGWPRSIVVGVDGSPESAAAARTARELADRFGSSLRFVAAVRDEVDLDVARKIAPDLEELPGRAVEELHVLSELADLVVVGSRGLKGVRALGSVSERVAHDALCSVLVVRGAPSADVPDSERL